MKKFKNKETGVIYIVNTKSVEELFEKNPLYVEVKEKETKSKTEKETKETANKE